MFNSALQVLLYRLHPAIDGDHKTLSRCGKNKQFHSSRENIIEATLQITWGKFFTVLHEVAEKRTSILERSAVVDFLRGKHIFKGSLQVLFVLQLSYEKIPAIKVWLEIRFRGTEIEIDNFS